MIERKRVVAYISLFDLTIFYLIPFSIVNLLHYSQNFTAAGAPKTAR